MGDNLEIIKQLKELNLTANDVLIQTTSMIHQLHLETANDKMTRLDLVIAIVCDEYDVTPQQVKSRCRSAKMAQARFEVIW